MQQVTQAQSQKKQGCFNREFKMEVLVQDGYKTILPVTGNLVRVGNYVNAPFRMSTDCKFDLRANDPKCQGCKHQ